MKILTQVALLLGLCAAFTPKSEAELITFKFTGTVTFLGNVDRCPDILNQVDVGDKISGSYTFDRNTIGVESIDLSGLRYAAIKAGEFTLNDFSGSVSTGGDSCIDVENDNNTDPADDYNVNVEMPGAHLSYPQAYPQASQMALSLHDASGLMLANNQLTTIPPELPTTVGSDKGFAIYFGSNDSIVGEIDTLELVVPTPPTDSTPPTVIEVVANPDRLWPANGKMVAVTVAAHITDDKSGVASATLIIDDEYNQFNSEVPMVFDAASGLWAATIQLRALRLPFDFSGGGRSYMLTVQATDGAGNQSNSAVGTEVLVPHDQRNCTKLKDAVRKLLQAIMQRLAHP
jgi:hypothetical protein